MNQEVIQSEKKTNVFAIVGFVLSFFLSLFGLIFSIIGLKKSKETNSGKGLSIAGIVISSIGMIMTFLMIVSLPATIKATNNAREKTYCPNAYDCVSNGDNTYSCKYVDAEGNINNVNCSSDYVY